MGPIVDQVVAAADMPLAADVVVIGGGIIGASTALFLSRRGVSTVLCEKGHIAGEQSSRNWGWVRGAGRDIRELPLMAEAAKIWPNLRQITGCDLGYRPNGVVYMASDEKGLARREAWLRTVGDLAGDARLIGQRELREVLPGVPKSYVGALYAPNEGYAEPQKVAPAIARAAQEGGATILENCAVRGIETSAGRVSGVVTENGRIACSTVVLSGGAWSGLFCKSLGLRLPQLQVRASAMRSKPSMAGLEPAVWGSGFAFRKRMDGGYTIASGTDSRHDIVPDSFRYAWDFLPLLTMEWRSVDMRMGTAFVTNLRTPLKWKMDEASPFEKTRVLDPAPDERHLASALADLVKALPQFKDVEIVERWAGVIDAMPDTVPVISETDIPGFIIATGFSGHGFGIGPGAGKLVASMVVGDTPTVDPKPFRLSRYTDGSNPRPTTGT